MVFIAVNKGGMRLRIAVTGHRPNKLWGYDYSHDNYIKLFSKMYDFLKENETTHCISGMALGVDTIFALAALRYKRDNPERNVIVECAIPCRNHSSQWSTKDKGLYNSILVKADRVTLVSDEEYKPWLMQRRNEYMVDNCDLLLAIWDGTKGGTGNCVKYAQKKDKKIVQINPKEI